MKSKTKLSLIGFTIGSLAGLGIQYIFRFGFFIFRGI